MPIVCLHEGRCVPIPESLLLKINLPANFNQLLRDGRRTILVRGVERRVPILVMNIKASVSFHKLLRDGRLPIACRDIERREPILGVAEGKSM